MAFNARGYLDPGLHSMKLDDLEQEFVTPFPHSTTRKDILDNYKRHGNELSAMVPEYTQIIDGSYVTNKNDPGDIDLVCFIDGDFLDALPVSDQLKIGALLSGKVTKASHMCDAYFFPSYPEHHPKYEFYRSKRKYWLGEFGYDRSDNPKGLVVIETKPLPPATAAAPATGVAP